MANMNQTTVANFIPEIWSDEVVATYKSNLVLANLVRNINHQGKKGDSIHIPNPNRSAASEKQAGLAVNGNVDTAGDIIVSIDQHFEWSMYIEDIAELQALSSMRKFYTDDAGYALAKTVDTKIVDALKSGNQAAVAATVNTTSGVEYRVDSTGNTTLTNWKTMGFPADTTAVAAGDTFTGSGVVGAGTGKYSIGNAALELSIAASGGDAIGWDKGILLGMEVLNDNDVPMNDRVMVLSASAYTELLGTDRFTEQAFIGNGNAIKTGNVGSIYGMDVYVSSNVGTGATEKALMFQKDALVLATQQSVRSQTQYQQDQLSDLFTADTVFGTKLVRPSSVVELTGTMS